MDSTIAAFGRMFFGSLVMIAYLVFTNNYTSIFHLNLKSMGWIFITALFLFYYVLYYYTALKYEKASVVTSLLTLAFPITVILQNINTNTFKTKDIPGILSVTAGIILFIYLPKLVEKIKQGAKSYGRG